MYKQDISAVHKGLFDSVSLDNEILEALLDIGKVQTFSNLDKVCAIGDRSNFIGFVIKGRVTVLDAQGAALAQVHQGDVFGEISYILGCAHTASIVGVGEGSFLRIDFKDLEHFLLDKPLLQSQWSQWLSVKVAERLMMFVHDIREYIALVAHDEKKERLIEFASEHYELLSKFDLVATATTGKFLLEKAQLNVSRSVSSGPIGGDQAIGSLITTGNIKAVIFLKDPLNAHPHRSDIEALTRLCDVHNIPLATNTASAELLLKGLVMQNSATHYFNALG